jgi:hypothetical protein
MAKKDKPVQVRMSAELAAEAKAKAVQQERALSDVIRELLRKWLGK